MLNSELWNSLVGFFFLVCGDHSPTTATAPSLHVLIMIDTQLSPVNSLSSDGCWFSYITGSSSVQFLPPPHFGGGRLLHKVQFLIFRIPTVDLAIRLAISGLMVLLKVVSSFPVLTSRSIFRSRFLRYPGRPPPRFFTLFLPSWQSAPSGFLVPHWPWYTFFWRCSPCTVPLLHGGSSLCG
jgi:hypothetical protein